MAEHETYAATPDPVPPAVRRAEREADAALKAHVEAQQKQAEEDRRREPRMTDPGEAPKTESTAQTPAPKFGEGEGVAPSVPEEAPPAPGPGEAESDATWEHRYRTLQGKYRNETSRLRTQVSVLSEQVAASEARVSEFLSRVQPPGAHRGNGNGHAAPATTVDPRSLGLSQKEIDDYGEDTIALVARVAQGAVAQRELTFDREMQQLRSQMAHVGQSVQQTEQNRFFSTLDSTVPEWRRLNEDPTFLDWLGEGDPLTGRERRTFLDEAVRNGDGDRAAAFFGTYLAQTRPAPTRDPRTPATDLPGRQPARMDLSQLAAPGRGRSAAPPPAEEARPIIPQAQIAQFYRDVQTGKYRGRDAEMQRTEHAIFAALQEGRVSP